MAFPVRKGKSHPSWPAGWRLEKKDVANRVVRLHDGPLIGIVKHADPRGEWAVFYDSELLDRGTYRGRGSMAVGIRLADEVMEGLRRWVEQGAVRGAPADVLCRYVEACRSGKVGAR